MNEFTSVKSEKISNLISEQIKSAILNGIFVTGDKLPSERELAERFHASRISIREALKGLEAAGFLEIRHGAGVFVVEMDSKSMSDSLFSILRIQGTSINELTEARAILEPIVAKLATEKITDTEIAALEENIAETKKLIKSNPSLASAKNIEFHSMIAETTRNTVITITMQTLFRVVAQMTLEISNNVSRRIAITNDAIKEHEDIVKGMKDRDAERVYQLMLRHISQVQSGFNMLKSDKPA
jgi:GntR family transcriptional repressor for pyruvate dehydrogenase complex